MIRRCVVGFFIAVVLLGCERHEQNISKWPSVAPLMNQCMTTRSELILVRPNFEPVARETIAPLLVVPAGSDLAPRPLPEYQRGERRPSDFAQPLRVLPRGTRFTVDSIWILRTGENEMVRVLARVPAIGTAVDMSHLMSMQWSAALANGHLTASEHDALARTPFFDIRFAATCHPE